MSHRVRRGLQLAAGLALAAALSAAASARPPHAGQFCTTKKAAPAGFLCVKAPDGRFKLAKKA